MSLERRIERLEHTNGNGATGDPYLHVATVMPSGAIQLRKLDGSLTYVSYDEFTMIAAQYGRHAPFVLMDK